MASAASEHWRDEKINGIVYDMSPTPGYRHGIINGNIYTIIKQGLKNSICLVTIENLNFKYHPDMNDDYLCPDIMETFKRRLLQRITPVYRRNPEPFHSKKRPNRKDGYL